MKQKTLAFLVLAALVAGCATTDLTAPPASRDSSPPPSSPADPASTLHPDSFDAPQPVSVAEAERASGSAGQTSHEGHGDQGQVIYTCPMHPEVTSATPGTCPKCGMTLVRKE